MAINYQNIVPWGRSFDEYRDMFLLDDMDLKSNILGIGDGPASFNAILSSRGGRVTSVDPTYSMNAEQFRMRIAETHQEVVNQTKNYLRSFVWDRFKNLDELVKTRLEAMEVFCADFEKGKKEKRYIESALPGLPFPDKSFDLVLCAHFLFFYSQNLDTPFHVASVLEAIRLGNEVRIFPIVDLNSEISFHLKPVMDVLASKGIRHGIQKVKYHFQKTGNEMLRIWPD